MGGKEDVWWMMGMSESAKPVTKKPDLGLRNSGILLTFGAMLFLVSSVWHGIIHPGVGATAADSMTGIAQQASIWIVAHLFFAASSLIFSAAALAILVMRSRLANTPFGMGAWSLLVVLGGLGATLTTMEATVQADAAVAGDLPLLAMWLSLSRGFEIVMILLPIALLGISFQEFRAPTPITPRWGSALSALGAFLVIVAIIGASWLRIEALGPLFAGAILPMLWFVWLGASIAKKG